MGGTTTSIMATILLMFSIMISSCRNGDVDREKLDSKAHEIWTKVCGDEEQADTKWLVKVLDQVNVEGTRKELRTGIYRATRVIYWVNVDGLFCGINSPTLYDCEGKVIVENPYKRNKRLRPRDLDYLSEIADVQMIFDSGVRR